MSLFSKFLSKKNYRSVLFVCTANITRSASAEALFRKMTQSMPDKWEAASAGTRALVGSPAHPIISFILQLREISNFKHRSKQLTKVLIDKFQWIVVMETAHKDLVLKLSPDASERTFLFRELSGAEQLSNYNMPDPTGKDVEDYAELFQILDTELPLVYKKLENKVNDLMWQDQDK